MSNKDMILFKDEVLDKLRELESKFFSEISRKNSEINLNLSTFNEKVNSILDSNRKMIESVTKQKLNFEKIKELDSNWKHIDEVLTTHNIKISSITSEMEKIKFRYDKIISENIEISGYIGPGCNFRNLKEFIVSSIADIRKLKEEKEIIKREEKELRTKVELMMRNITSMVEFNSTRIKEYTNSKDRIIENMLDDKFKNYNERSLQSSKQLIDNQNLLEDKIREISKEIGKINNIKNDFNSSVNQKFDEINKKEEEMNQKLYLALYEVKEVQKMKKDLAEEIKSIYLKMDSINQNQNKISTQENIIKTEVNSNKKELIPNSYIKANYNTNNGQKDKNILKIKSFGSMIKNDLPSLSNPVIQNNIKANINPGNKTVTNNITKELNFIPNSFSDKKFALKENDFLKIKQNLKIKGTNEKFSLNKNIKESPLIKSIIKSNNINDNNNDNEVKVKEDIFQKTLNNIKIDKIEIKNDEQILSDKSIKNFFATLETHSIEPKLKLANLEYKKKISDKVFSMSDDEESQKYNEKKISNKKSKKNNYIRTLNNNRSNKDIILHNKNLKNLNLNKYINNLKNHKKWRILNNYNDDLKDLNVDTVQKKIQTSRDFNTVDCFMVNLNLLDIPNINDNNLNDSYNNSKRVLKERKINSVDSKKKKKNRLILENTNFKFYSSKNNIKTLK